MFVFVFFFCGGRGKGEGNEWGNLTRITLGWEGGGEGKGGRE